MSDILIKGVEMPDNCFECPCCRHDSVDGIKMEQCNLTLDVFDVNYFERWNGRAQNCPLVEIPTPHGRLGDLDALYEEISNGNKAYNGIEGYDGKYPNIANVDDCLDAIKYSDTVIEAEGSEE